MTFGSSYQEILISMYLKMWSVIWKRYPAHREDLTYSYFQATKLTTSAVTWEIPDNCTLSCWLYESVWNDDTSLIACPPCSTERAKFSNSACLMFSCVLWNFLSLPSDNNSRVAFFLKWITLSLSWGFLKPLSLLRYPYCWGDSGTCYHYSFSWSLNLITSHLAPESISS